MAIISGIVAAVGAIGAAIGGAVSSFLGGWAALGATLLKAAAGIGLNLLASAIAGKPQDKASFSVQGRLQTGGTVPRSIVVGQTATAGSLVYANTWGSSGGTPNAYITQVIALADYPVKALTGILVNGILCELGTQAHAQYGFPVLEYRKGGKDHLWIKFYDGTQATSDPFVVNTVSSSERPYEPSRVGRGIAYAICTSRVNDELYSGFPQFKFIVDGMRQYDPSRDDTVGGVGPQRRNDPATWGGDGDYLPVVQVYNLLLGIRWNTQWLYGLQNTSVRRIPAAHAIQQIAKCRALIAGPDGNEPTYRSGAEVQVGAPIRDALEGILTAGQGRLAEIGGVYKPYVGEPDAPAMFFSDDDILSTESQSFTPFFGLSDTVNGITATYPSPDNGWNPAEAPPLYNTGFEAEDGNRRLLADVDLDFVPYKGQVQRLMKSALAEARRARRHTIVMPPRFWVLEPGDVIAWTSERNGYINKQFRVDGVIDQPNLDVVLDITEVDPTDYDWDQETDYRPPVDGTIAPGWPVPQPMYGWQVEPAILYDSDGNPRRPSIRVICAPDQDDVRNVWVQVRLKSSGDVVFDSDSTAYDAPYQWVLNGTFLPNTTYQVRGQFVPDSPRPMEWSGWMDVTTDNVKLLPGLDFDPYSGVIGFDQLGPDLANYQDWIGSGLRDIHETLEELDARVADQEGGNSYERQQLREQLKVTYDTVTAEYERRVEVLAEADHALALRIETLTASVFDPNTGLPAVATAVSALRTEVEIIDGVVTSVADSVLDLDSTVGRFSAEGKFRVSTEATPSGSLARIGLSVAASEGDQTSSASIFLDAIAGGLSRVAINADQFVVIAGNDVKRPFVVQGGSIFANELFVNWAKITDVNIGWAQIENAVINNAVFGTTNLDYDSVSARAQFNGSGSLALTDANNVWWTIGTLVIANPNPTAVLLHIVGNYSGSLGPNASGTFSMRIVNETTGEVAFSNSFSFSTGGSSAQQSRDVNSMALTVSDIRGNNTYRVQIMKSTGTMPGANFDTKMMWQKR